MIEQFLRDVDAVWPSEAPSPTTLRIIGSAALMLQTTYRRGTKDSDVLELGLEPKAREALLTVAGPDSVLLERHRLYVDLVSPGLPFLPQVPDWIPFVTLTHFDIHVLSVVDVVVSKLKRFSAVDRSDIDQMVELGHVDHRVLLRRFEAAWDVFLYDARAPDLLGYAANLNTVERDMLGVAETPFDLPEWADR